MSGFDPLPRRTLLRRLGLLGGMAWAGAPGLSAATAEDAAADSDPLHRPGARTRRALGALLLDVCAAGERLVCVGERGVILLSDDAGRQWRQAACPVSVTLTAVRFPTPQLGWAVGHAGVVLNTRDGGVTWQRQLNGAEAARIERFAAQASGDAARLKRAEQRVAEGADKPLLGLHFDSDGRRGFVHGAYGLLFGTEDGGAHWQSWFDRIDNPRGLHLNAACVTGGTVCLAGEAGLLLRSDDGGQRFARLASPYEGSWFALAALDDGLLLAAGLRGNAWWSNDRGTNFKKAAVPLPISISAASVAPGGELLLVNQAGMVLASDDLGRHFRPLPLPPGPPATSVLPLADGSLVVTTVNGPLRLPRPVSSAAQAAAPTTANGPLSAATAAR